MQSIEEMLEEISGALKNRQWSSARVLIEEALATMPPDWDPVREEREFTIHAFWNTDEFFSYTAAFKDRGNGSLLWAGCSYSKLWWQLAEVNLEEDRLDNALVCVERGLALEPDHPILWIERGLILNRLSRHDEALATYKTAETIRDWAPVTQRARALRGQGAALIDLDRLNEAKQIFEHSLDLDPDNQVAKKEIEYIDHAIEDRRKRAEKLPWFIECVVHSPTDPLTKQLLAIVDGMESIPGPKTVGPENYSRIFHAFLENGWPGFEEAFDEIVPRTRSDYADIKRDLLRESIFNRRVHSRMARVVLGKASVEEVLQEANSDRVEKKAN